MYGIRLLVWGPRACFTCPEWKAERMSYEFITPSAARGLLSAIYWKPAIRWVIDKIHVLNEIKTGSIRRNEINRFPRMAAFDATSLDSRTQRTTKFLVDVAYVIEAHFERTPYWGKDDNDAKHHQIFLRRASRGQQFHAPFLGCAEFPAYFRLLEEGEPIPASFYAGQVKHYDRILCDIVYSRTDSTPRYAEVTMVDGTIVVPRLEV